MTHGVGIENQNTHHRERAGVTDFVERANDLLKVDVAAPYRPEIPSSPRITEL
jgi:hypothetical protein